MAYTGVSQVASRLLLLPDSVTLLAISTVGRVPGPLAYLACTSLNTTVTPSSSGRAPARLVRIVPFFAVCPRK